MALENGGRLGPYEIVTRLGAGGMGEVWRARDPRLGRDVAIKLLPDSFATDPERLARFEREAKLLASLQHANIAVLHGLEESDGRRFLVMQCIEGESLAQRLERGPLPLMETLEVMGAIAAALEVAHESGIVHRDLKPGNVMVTPSGDVKVLDFGLAKGGAGASNSDLGLSASPTMTYAATNAGVILGTAAYMSPEQARGKPVDRRTDIWSFGCVFYECLTGKQAYAGETVSDIVARILQTEPDWELLPATTPARVRELVGRCLQKDARRRLRDIGDARIEIEDLAAGRLSASGSHVVPASALAPKRSWLVPALVATVVAAATAAWFAAGAFVPARQPGGEIRFVVPAPDGHALLSDGIADRISPDGQTLAMIAADSSGVSHVWVRRMDALAPRMLPGTENASIVFWSPDGKSLAFCANDRQLLRVAVTGGDPEPICEIKTARGGSWGPDGTILITPVSAGPIMRVSVNGGELTTVLRPDTTHGETGFRFPQFLPDGKHFLFMSLPPDSTGNNRIWVGSLDGSKRRQLMSVESGAFYAPPGWILFTRHNVLTAQRFDRGSLSLAGEPQSLGDVVQSSQFLGCPLATASNTGLLAYGTNDPVPARLQWLELSGNRSESPAVPPGNYFGVTASPDHKRALIMAFDRHRAEFLMLADLERGTVSQVTTTDEFATYPVWSPDGQHYAYMQDEGREPIEVRSTQDDSHRLLATTDPGFKRTDSWSSDGKWIVYDHLDPATKWDIWMVPADGGAPRPLVHSVANEQFASLSPDGRWLAFQSDESGSPEVYVLPFGSTGVRYQVSTGGGVSPGWSRDSRRLWYADPKQPGVLMVADLSPGATLAFGAPRVAGHAPKDVVSADPGPVGDRILTLMPAGLPRPQTVTVVQNWLAAIKQP